MKTKLAVLGLGVATLIGASAAQAAETSNTVVAAAAQLVQTQPAQAAPPSETNSTFFNMFGASSWTGTSGQMKTGEIVDFDPMQPKSWANLIDPKTHMKVHMTLTNPQYYTRFMTPGYYMKYMEPKTWLSYMDMATYEPLLKASTDGKAMGHWMNPGSYMHFTNPEGYMQLANPDAYMKMASAVTEGYSAESTSTSANMFNPFSWMKMFTDASSAMVPATTAEAQKKQ